MSMMQPFNAVETSIEPGLTLLEASAGTGKTFTLALLVVRLVVEKDIPLREILAVTFTRAATAELKERVGKFLREALSFCDTIPESKREDPLAKYVVYKSNDIEIQVIKRRLRNAVESIDEAGVYTIHSFCQKILTEFAFESGSEFDRELVQDESDLIREIQNRFWRKEIQTLPIEEYRAVTSVLRNSETLHKRISPALNFPHVHVIGSINEKPTNYLIAIQRFCDQFEKWFAQWERVREDVELILETAIHNGELNGVVYRKATFFSGLNSSFLTELRYALSAHVTRCCDSD